jgi:thymidylate synthase (FAD)
MKVALVSVTNPVDPHLTAEQLIVYTARVSSPQNQANLDTGPKLLRYCIKKRHWSVFSMVDMTLEIETSRAISAQILRHKSFDFQEFSQRYAEAFGFEIYEARSQDLKNRQNSTDDLSTETKEWFLAAQESIQAHAKQLYDEALGLGIAKECARFLLPMGVSTRVYMKGSIRSWIHYFEVRRAKSTQLEHRDIADAAYLVFKQEFPTIAEALQVE